MCWTEFTELLPSPPASEVDNLAALATIQSNPHLFHIVTPINVDRFQSLLSSHPNQPFVGSVCRGLRQGFWPFANIHYGEWPLTWDNSQHTPKKPEEAAFLQEQTDKEVICGRYLEDLILWKADVSEDYRCMPMHPLWHLKQVVCYGSKRHVDRCNVFGGHASQRIWHAPISNLGLTRSLLSWIEHKETL